MKRFARVPEGPIQVTGLPFPIRAAVAAFALVVGIAGVSTTAAAQDDPYLRGIRTSEVDEPGTNVNRGKAVGIVRAPFDRVVSVLEDYAHYADFLPEFRASRVIAQRGSRAMVYLEVGALHQTITLWAQVQIRTRENDDGTKVIDARMVQGNLDHFAATWSVRRLDDQRTEVSIELIADPDLPAPSGLVTHENVRMALKSIRNLRVRLRRA